MRWGCRGWRRWTSMPSFWSHTEVRSDLACHNDEVQHGANEQMMTDLRVCTGQNVRPLNKREYILDIATEAEPVDSNYSLWFRRVIWSLALKLDNELYVTMHYNQVEISWMEEGTADVAVAITLINYCFDYFQGVAGLPEGFAERGPSG